MALLPEFFTLLGVEIFSAASLLSALLDREIPSPAPWLFQVAAAAGLAELIVSQRFVASGSTDLTRFWISVFYLTMSVCSVVGLNIYIAAVSKKMGLASIFSGTVTVPAIIVSGLFISSYLEITEVSFTPLTIAILAVPAIVAGLSSFRFHGRVSKPTKPVVNPLLHEPSTREPVSKPSEVPMEAPSEVPRIFEPLDIHSILAEWEESRKKNEQAQ